MPSTDYQWSSPIYCTFSDNGPADATFQFDNWITNAAGTTKTNEKAAYGALIVTGISISPGAPFDKPLWAAIGQALNTGSNVLGYLSIAKDGIQFVERASSRLYFQIVTEVATQNHQLYSPIELSVGLNKAAKQSMLYGGG